MCGAPVAAFGLAEIDRAGVLRAALGARPGEVWLLRPDAHVAAVLPGADPAAVGAAVRAVLGRGGAVAGGSPVREGQVSLASPREETGDGVLPASG
ncbi:hypothetical protein DEF23_26745 [Marinitenerispora sediminis]|uniref:Uncharacterized protein n=1 Tax=Marinitenerispora sediminis TaxID=1931232 RepID=A0A368SXS3_9ACTN|nr:hypothetical protein DEF23_26745 [Marinitenerispora sediminis]RCV47989.1 hypothetical protein DEF24_26675 [Marinitenerispora sediminis]